MQTSTGNTSDKGTGVPPQDDREEDSGLHDIRSMASSAKMRISSKRITTSPPVDDDILASSSAGWKAVALPEPAKMISLPEPVLEQPAEGSERKSKKELKAERTSASKIAKEAISVETSAAISPAPVSIDKQAEISTAPIIGARFAKREQKSKSKAGLYALIGTGIAAAAGVGWYVSTQMGGAKDSAAQQVASVSSEEAAKGQAQTAPAAAPAIAAGSAATVTPIEPTPPPPEAAADTTVATGMAATESKPDDADENAAADKGSKRGKAEAKKSPKAKDADEKEKLADKKAEPKEVAPKQDATKKENTGGEGEPSFDALLKEAGVESKKPQKVVLDKKSLSGADIKKGMGSVAAKAQACYAGTQGTAQVKLTVTPDGKVEKVAVTGVFAGTPVGACVTSAVKGASFPPWDGGPQSFGYSYLLAE